MSNNDNQLYRPRKYQIFKFSLKMNIRDTWYLSKNDCHDCAVYHVLSNK